MLRHRLRASCWLASKQLWFCVLARAVLIPLLYWRHLRQSVAIWTQCEGILGKDRLIPTFGIHPAYSWLADMMRYGHLVGERSCDINLSWSRNHWLYNCEWDDLMLNKGILHGFNNWSWTAVKDNIRYLRISNGVLLPTEGSVCGTCYIDMVETTKSACIALRESLWCVDETAVFNASLYELILKTAVASPNLH